MIIFGTRTKFLTAFGTQQTCSHCNNGQLNLAYTVSYFHIFWIPMFPIGKKGITQCPHCKQTLSENELSPQSRSLLNTQKGSAKTPLKYFAGLILIGVLIVSVITINVLDKKGGYIRKPQIGDVYQVKGISENQYVLWKVTAVEGDSVVFSTNKQNNLSQADINEQTVFGKLDADFTPSTFKMAKRNIKSMTQNNKNLVAIFRK